MPTISILRVLKTRFQKKPSNRSLRSKRISGRTKSPASRSSMQSSATSFPQLSERSLTPLKRTLTDCRTVFRTDRENKSTAFSNRECGFFISCIAGNAVSKRVNARFADFCAVGCFYCSYVLYYLFQKSEKRVTALIHEQNGVVGVVFGVSPADLKDLINIVAAIKTCQLALRRMRQRSYA